MTGILQVLEYIFSEVRGMMDMKFLEKVVKRLKKFKEDLEKESVSHGDHKPNCCTLPEEVLYKEKEPGKDEKAA